MNRLQELAAKKDFDKKNSIIVKFQPLAERKIAQGTGNYDNLRAVLNLINNGTITDHETALDQFVAIS